MKVAMNNLGRVMALAAVTVWTAAPPPAVADGPGFVLGTPGYANLEDFLEALDRTIPGTNESTTPAYLFGLPDSAWVDSNSFLTFATDAGGNTDVLFINGTNLDLQVALDPSNGYLIDSDDDGEVDSLSQQFYYDRALGVLQNLTWKSIPMPFANVSSDGIEVVTSAVYAQFGPDKWVAGLRMDMNVQVEFVVDEPELPELGAVSVPTQTATLHPMAYVTDKGAAVSWAQLLAKESPFLNTLQTATATATLDITQWGAVRVLTTAGADPQEVFVELEAASVEEYRNAIAVGAGIVQESITADGYTIIDGNGDTHVLFAVDPSCTNECWRQLRAATVIADMQYDNDITDCKKDLGPALRGAGILTVGCCVGGGLIGTALGGGVPGFLTILGCEVGVGICSQFGLETVAYEVAQCVAGAEGARRLALQIAWNAFEACCGQCDDPSCLPMSVDP